MSETVTPLRSRGRDTRRARAKGAAVKFPYIRRQLAGDRPAEHRSDRGHRGQRRDHPRGNRHRVPPRPGVAAPVEGRRRRRARASGCASRAAWRAPCCARAPSEFTLYARNPERNVRFGGDATVFSPVGGPPFVTDLDRGRRYGTLEDLHNFIKLAHSAPAIHFSGGTHGRADGYSAGQAPPRRAVRLLPLQRPGLRGDAGDPRSRGRRRAHGGVLFGEQYVDEHAVVLGNINSNSPLTFDGRMLGALRMFAAHNQGTIVVPAVLAGAMGPVTAGRLHGGDPRRDAGRHGAHADRAAGSAGHHGLLRRCGVDAHRLRRPSARPRPRR